MPSNNQRDKREQRNMAAWRTLGKLERMEDVQPPCLLGEIRVWELWPKCALGVNEGRKFCPSPANPKPKARLRKIAIRITMSTVHMFTPMQRMRIVLECTPC